MPHPEFDYEDLDNGVQPVDPTQIPTGEPWIPSDLPPNSPIGSTPQEAPPRIFGEEIGIIAKRPLVFVPGIMGSRLEVYEDRLTPGGVRKRVYVEDVWLPFDLVNFSTVQVSKLINPQKRPPSGENGLVDGTYNPLISFLTEEMGFKLGEQLFIFAYDWTRSNRDSGKRLKAFIDLIIASFPWPPGTAPSEKKVNVIAHSMGGLVNRSAIRLWGAKVRGSMYLASPHYGSTKAYFFLHDSFRQVPWLLNWILGRYTTFALGSGGSFEEDLRWVVSGMPSAYELLPDEEYFRRQSSIAKKFASFQHAVAGGAISQFETSIVGLSQTYYQDPIARFPNQLARGFSELGMKFKREIGFDLPGEIYSVIASTSECTQNLGYLRYGSSALGGTPEAPRGEQLVDPPNSRNGDETVPYISGKGPGTSIDVSGKHCQVPNSRETFYWIARFLQDNP